MSKRKCLKGWILAPSPTDGENVPFFVYVRDKDIKWNIENVSKELNQLSLKGNNRKVFYPDAKWKFTINEWHVTLYMDGTYDAHKKINIHKNFVKISDTMLMSNVDLPLLTENNNHVHAQLTMNIGDTALYSASSFVGEFDSTETISFLRIGLISNAYFFDEGIPYHKSNIFINVHGKVHLE